MPDTTNTTEAGGTEGPSEAQLAVGAALEVLNETGAPDVVRNDGYFLGAFLAGVAAVFRTQGNKRAEAVAMRTAGHALTMQLIRNASGTKNEAAAG